MQISAKCTLRRMQMVLQKASRAICAAVNGLDYQGEEKRVGVPSDGVRCCSCEKGCWRMADMHRRQRCACARVHELTHSEQPLSGTSLAARRRTSARRAERPGRRSSSHSCEVARSRHDTAQVVATAHDHGHAYEEAQEAATHLMAAAIESSSVKVTLSSRFDLC